MEGIAILGVAAAIVWLIIWAIRNEDAPSIGEQKGLFKMVDPGDENAGSDEKSTH